MQLSKQQTEQAIKLLEDAYEFINFIKQDEGEEVDKDNLDIQISDFLNSIGNNETNLGSVEGEGPF